MIDEEAVAELADIARMLRRITRIVRTAGAPTIAGMIWAAAKLLEFILEELSRMDNVH